MAGLAVATALDICFSTFIVLGKELVMILGHIRTYLLAVPVVCHHLDHYVGQTHFHLHLAIVALSVDPTLKEKHRFAFMIPVMFSTSMSVACKCMQKGLSL